jgi:hypothetical protein
MGYIIGYIRIVLRFFETHKYDFGFFLKTGSMVLMCTKSPPPTTVLLNNKGIDEFIVWFIEIKFEKAPLA